MECIRFGSSIPGEYWGCCAGDIFQNFKQDPDTPASIQMLEGDSGSPLTHGRSYAYLGPTLRDVFWARLKYSTFGLQPMPNHFFLAVLEDSQLRSTHGQKWLAILKEAGFEFIRTVDNSVYTGEEVGGWGEEKVHPEPKPCGCGDPDCNVFDDYDDEERAPHKNHIFGLFRNIGTNGKIDDPFTPPKEWTDLPSVVNEAWTFTTLELGAGQHLADQQRNQHLAIWNEKIGPQSIKTEEEIVAVGAPVFVGALRTEFPVETKARREERLKSSKANPSAGTQYIYTQTKLNPPVAPILTPPTTSQGE